MKHWPFNVIEEDTLPKLRVEYKNEQKTFSPEEISSMVLIKMKKTAEVGTNEFCVWHDTPDDKR